MNIGVGIDFSGYTTGKTSLAFVEIDGDTIAATLLRGSALSQKRKTSDALADVLPAEARVMLQCLQIGCVAVDIPIDLQGLPGAKTAHAIWQLTRRPIDHAIGAMPPFADRIGAPVARFAAIMRAGKFGHQLGKRLFEAYPAGTLKLLDIEAGAYKGPNGLDALRVLCGRLNVQSNIESDDDIDAVICAITAATPADRLYDLGRFAIQGGLPKGFRIPARLAFSSVRVTGCAFDDWFRKMHR